MSELDQTINERVAEVAEDLELQAGLKLSNKQLDELRITGRVTIVLVTIAPYLPKIIKYLHQSDDEDVVWLLLINTISGDAEITLKGKQSITTRLGMVSQSSYTENIKFSTGGFFMEETHDIVTPVFKTKSEPVSKPKFSPRPAVKMKVDNVQLTFFKGASPSLAAEISKIVVRYAH